MATPPDRLLSAEEIRALLIELGDELARTGESGELFLLGGAALALGYDAREATREVDALSSPRARSPHRPAGRPNATASGPTGSTMP